MKIGVILESFRQDFRTSVKIAKSLGFDGVQVHAAYGELNVDNLTLQKCRDLILFVYDAGLEFAALCGDIGSQLFYEPDSNRHLIDKMKKMLELAMETRSKVVTTHIGVVPKDKSSNRYRNMQKAASELAVFASSLGGYFAVETGPEKAEVLKEFLDSLPTKGIAVNLDPANLVMAADDDPVAAVTTLKDYIVHTHAKDGVLIKRTDTERIYNAAHDGLKPIVYDEYFREVPLGKGGVDFDGYLKALQKIGYKGFLTIEREVGAEPMNDIVLARDFLKTKLAAISSLA